MAGLDQLKQTFFDECSELLQQTEAGLTEIREGHGTDDTINAVFRAVHSVKGGAGIFGFEALVEFAHVFETVLDALRRGSVTATPDVAEVLLAAGDTFRAAAIEQLEVWGQRIGVEVIRQAAGSDPAAVVFDAAKAATARQADALIVDTAGRVEKFRQKYARKGATKAAEKSTAA